MTTAWKTGMILLLAMSLSACTSKEEQEADAQEEALKTATVQVTSIEGDTITGEMGVIEVQTMDAPQNRPEGTPEQPPEKPDGEGAKGDAPVMNVFVGNGETLTFTVEKDTAITVEFLQGKGDGTLEDLHEGDVLDLVYDENDEASCIVVKNLNAGMGFGGSDTVENGTAAVTLENDAILSSMDYISSGNDENALRIDGASVQLTDVSIKKNGGDSSNTENGDFYGANAALLALNGANVTINGGTVETSAVNGNAVFSTGDGTEVHVSNTKIHTVMRNSGGLQTTGGALMEAKDLDVVTEGDSSAAIRSDRGGGTVDVSGGNYVTYGLGSPAVYSTADITVNDAVLTANASEGVVVEGKNSVTLNNCTLIGSMQSTHEEENVHGVMIYQSMSGDADLGEAVFKATGGCISTTVGDLFYVTNTKCALTLENVVLTTADGGLLTVSGNNSSRGWGTKGANGADVTFDCVEQTLEGKISVDAISSLNMELTDSTFIGSINEDQEGGNVTLSMDETSTWKLTADSYVSSYEGKLDQVETNGFHLYVNGECVRG